MSEEVKNTESTEEVTSTNTDTGETRPENEVPAEAVTEETVSSAPETTDESSTESTEAPAEAKSERAEATGNDRQESAGTPNRDQQRESRPQQRGGRDPRRSNPRFRRKVCRFCHEEDAVIDYKRSDILERFITDRGKILPRRVTGTCAKHQRALATSIKRARILALLPFMEK